MDLSKLRGAKGNPGEIDQSPPASNGAGDKRELPSKSPKNPKSVTETNAYKQGKAGIGQFWSNYVHLLSNYFSRMSRSDQEQLIVRGCQVVTVGCAIVLTTFFYQFVPLLIRVFTLPLFIVGSWFVATKVVSPIIIAQFENKLNPPD
ncbi:MAG: hypothetical protein SGJ27_28700 [Candidatus Melainabacteria bacterium]|nr:hypothetical protein [Candidatus Melainabacteria bacterium]